jgi:imidazolonepropionase-like amidohydrolase
MPFAQLETRKSPPAWKLRIFAVRVVFGTDGGLRAATTTAALALGLQGKVGPLAEGLPADIIAGDGDPLADIGAMESILFVMQNGRVIVERPK